MSAKLTKKEAVLYLGAVAVLVACSVWQHRQLVAAQTTEKKALYAERLRIAQVILENEMLAAAYLTSTDARTRERARHYLGNSPL